MIHGGTLELVDALARMGLALLLGSLIGLERQLHQKMAGLRTNALVALGSAGFVVFSALTAQGDPTRVAAQVVSGIGFLGAGVIMHQGVNVHGLNTAATLWCSAMVGTFAGGGFWVPCCVAAFLIILTNLALRRLVYRLQLPSMRSVGAEAANYIVEISCKGAEEAHMRSVLLHSLTQAGLGLREIDSADIPETTKVTVTAKAHASKRDDVALEQIVGRLSLEPNVSAASWKVSAVVHAES
jgi:putative Mg2+ transporter-C (MgtC) family protein